MLFIVAFCLIMFRDGFKQINNYQDFDKGSLYTILIRMKGRIGLKENLSCNDIECY